MERGHTRGEDTYEEKKQIEKKYIPRFKFRKLDFLTGSLVF